MTKIEKSVSKCLHSGENILGEEVPPGTSRYITYIRSKLVDRPHIQFKDLNIKNIYSVGYIKDGKITREITDVLSPETPVSEIPQQSRDKDFYLFSCPPGSSIIVKTETNIVIFIKYYEW